jgi:Polyketide cyclase / dehydrase and lipid transport
MINTVTEFDEGRLIAWAPKPASGLGARFAGRIWRYELEPVDGGTRVRETWDISQEALRFFLRYVAAAQTRRDMAKSLERLERLEHLVTTRP